eukprot:SAG11_NODE_8395_length_1021_cov_1.078091_2_plen_151_part_00
MLDTHDLEWAVAPTMLELALRLAKIYEIDLRERPKEMKARKAEPQPAAPAEIGASEIVDAGALDKDWSDLTESEREAALELGYTEASFSEVQSWSPHITAPTGNFIRSLCLRSADCTADLVAVECTTATIAGASHLFGLGRGAVGQRARS